MGICRDSTFEKLRQQYEDGDGKALFAAIEFCFMFDQPAPAWVKDGFAQGWRRYMDVVPDGPGERCTLAGAFQVSRGKEFRDSTGRRRFNMEGMLYLYIEKRKRAGVPVDEALFEDAAEYLNDALRHLPGFYAAHYGVDIPQADGRAISSGTARAWYYEHKRAHNL